MVSGNPGLGKSIFFINLFFLNPGYPISRDTVDFRFFEPKYQYPGKNNSYNSMQLCPNRHLDIKLFAK